MGLPPRFFCHSLHTWRHFFRFFLYLLYPPLGLPNLASWVFIAHSPGFGTPTARTFFWTKFGLLTLSRHCAAKHDTEKKVPFLPGIRTRNFRQQRASVYFYTCPPLPPCPLKIITCLSVSKKRVSNRACAGRCTYNSMEYFRKNRRQCVSCIVHRPPAKRARHAVVGTVLSGWVLSLSRALSPHLVVMGGGGGGGSGGGVAGFFVERRGKTARIGAQNAGGCFVRDLTIPGRTWVPARPS